MQGARTDMEHLGVQPHDPIDKFWKIFGQQMASAVPDAPAVAQAICDKIKELHAAITVGCMTDLYLHEMEECCVAGGGLARWAKSVQRLLGTKFRQVDTFISTSSEPPPLLTYANDLIARVADASASTAPAKNAPRFPSNCKIGEWLQERGLLEGCVVPKSSLLAAVIETKNRTTDTLTYNDTKAVMNVFFVFIATKYGNVGSCKTLFLHLVTQARATVNL